MLKKVVCIGAVLALAGLSQAAEVTNYNMVLTINYATGAATIQNVDTTASHSVGDYSITSEGYANPAFNVNNPPSYTNPAKVGYLQPGVRATTDTNGDTVWTPGAWKAIADQVIIDDTVVKSLLTVNAYGFGVFTTIVNGVTIGGVDSRNLTEGGTSCYGVFKKRTSADGQPNPYAYDMGFPLMPNSASLSDLKFTWGEIGQNVGDVYVGKIVLVGAPAPEPATLSVLAIGAVGVLLRKRRRR